jgi:hypothetical protein
MHLPLEPTPESYRRLYEQARAALEELGFVIAGSDLFGGRVETFSWVVDVERPRRPQDWINYYVALFGDGSGITRTYSERAVIQIEASSSGGYLVSVAVHKQVTDQSRESCLVEKGRDAALEQQLLSRIKNRVSREGQDLASANDPSRLELSPYRWCWPVYDTLGECPDWLLEFERNVRGFDF